MPKQLLLGPIIYAMHKEVVNTTYAILAEGGRIMVDVALSFTLLFINIHLYESHRRILERNRIIFPNHF